MTRKNVKRKKILGKKNRWFILLGTIFILVALYVCLYNIINDIIAGYEAQSVAERLDAYVGTILPETMPVEPAFEDDVMVAVVVDDTEYIGQLTIPGINITLPVISMWSYPNLKLAPCRYSGNAEEGNMIIAAHNYRTHFGKIAELNIGDEIQFVDMKGNCYDYVVSEKTILGSYELDELEQSGDWQLTLFTCNTNGSMRVVLRATQK